MGIHAHQVQVMHAAALDDNSPGGSVCGWRLDKGSHVENQRTNNPKAVVKTPLAWERVMNQVLLPARVRDRFLYHGATAWASSSGCEKLCLMECTGTQWG